MQNHPALKQGNKTLSSEEDDLVDKNPGLTEKLATIFEENLVFKDIPEANEPSRPKRDNMPAHMPM